MIWIELCIPSTFLADFGWRPVCAWLSDALSIKSGSPGVQRTSPQQNSIPGTVGWRNIASLTMSAVSSTFRAQFTVHSEKSAFSL
jgi:hypothetical protein